MTAFYEYKIAKEVKLANYTRRVQGQKKVDASTVNLTTITTQSKNSIRKNRKILPS